jgi:hypothetical protein
MQDRKELSDIIEHLFGSFKKTKEQMINDYIQGKITKKELDEFMENQK